MIEEDTFINKRRWSDIEVKFVNLFQAIKFFEIDICFGKLEEKVIGGAKKLAWKWTIYKVPEKNSEILAEPKM